MNYIKTIRMTVAAGCIAMTSLLSATAFAADIPVSSVTASSTFYTYNVNNLINGAGLSGNSHSGDWQTKWLTNGAVTGTLTFDVGSAQKIGSTTIWNYGAGCCGVERSVKDLGISYSVDGVTYTHFSDFVLNKTEDLPFNGQTFGLGFNARYIQFSLNSNYGDNYTGLSEVKFTTAVPEPETYAMLLAGLGLLGAAARRRQRV